jgi:hypothetical protein
MTYVLPRQEKAGQQQQHHNHHHQKQQQQLQPLVGLGFLKTG